jgi:hypothetical protein
VVLILLRSLIAHYNVLATFLYVKSVLLTYVLFFFRTYCSTYVPFNSLNQRPIQFQEKSADSFPTLIKFSIHMSVPLSKSSRKTSQFPFKTQIFNTKRAVSTFFIIKCFLSMAKTVARFTVGSTVNFYYLTVIYRGSLRDETKRSIGPEAQITFTANFYDILLSSFSTRFSCRACLFYLALHLDKLSFFYFCVDLFLFLRLHSARARRRRKKRQNM